VPRDITHGDIPLLRCGMDANGREVHATPHDQLRSLRDSVPHVRISWCGAVDQPAETRGVETWVDAREQEDNAMQDHRFTGEEQPPPRPQTVSPGDTQHRLKEICQRTEQVLACLRAERGSPRREITGVERQALIDRLKAQLQPGTNPGRGKAHREITSDEAPGHVMDQDQSGAHSSNQ
jgi:hypothetical protein